MNMNSQPQPQTVTEWEPRATPRAELLHGFEYTLRCQATTARHAATAFRTAAVLDKALADAHLPCTVRTEGPLVDINGFTAHIPDVSVECGRTADTPDTHIKPHIVVEVLSKATRSYDQTTKLTSYMQFLGYVNDYLLVDTDTLTVTQYTRNDGEINMITHTGDDIITLRATAEFTIRLSDIFSDINQEA